MSYSGAHHGGIYSHLNREYLVVDAPPSLSTVLSYVVIILIGLYNLVHYLDILPTLPLTQLAWNALVYATPPSLVIALEARRASTGNSTNIDSYPYAETRSLAAKSEAMRKIMGLSGDAFQYGAQRSRRMSNLNSIFKYGSPGSLPGLGNWDNSCYQNSILQGLAALPSLHEFLDHAAETLPGGNKRHTNTALKQLLEDLNSPKNLGRKMWTPAVLKSMSSWQQQDAQEYYSKVVDALEKELGKGLVELAQEKAGGMSLDASEANEDSKRQIRNPLEGMLAQRVGCLRCSYVEGLTLIPFNCLTIPLGNRESYNIASCLDEYTALEPITGVECPRCTLLDQKKIIEKLLTIEMNGFAPTPSIVGSDSVTGKMETGSDSAEPENEPSKLSQLEKRLLAVKQALEAGDFSDETLLKKCQIPRTQRTQATKTRQAVVARGPRALAIHVNRSVFDEYTGYLSKNYAAVQFPKFLDLSKWSIGVVDGGMETWTTNPAQSLLEGKSTKEPAKAAEDNKTLYTLRAAVTHQGRHENGHYIAYRRGPSVTGYETTTESSWWRLSDEDVTLTDEETVLAQGGVFMLFYEEASAADKADFARFHLGTSSSMQVPASTEELTVSHAVAVLGPQYDTRDTLDPGIQEPVNPTTGSQQRLSLGAPSSIPTRTTSLNPQQIGSPPSPSKVYSKDHLEAAVPSSPPLASDSFTEIVLSSNPSVSGLSAIGSSPTSPSGSGHIHTSPEIPPRKASRAKAKKSSKSAADAGSSGSSSGVAETSIRVPAANKSNMSPRMDSRMVSAS